MDLAASSVFQVFVVAFCFQPHVLAMYIATHLCYSFCTVDTETRHTSSSAFGK